MSIDMDVIVNALFTLLSLKHFFYLSLGVFLGLSLGIIPGLGGGTGTAIILPFIFGMEPGIALAMMIGLQSVVTTSDTFPSVLMGIPGSAGSQATVVDGFPLSKKGEAARALGAAFMASMCGGVFGALALTIAIFGAVKIILAIGFSEQLTLMVFALSMVGMMTGLHPWKGFASCGLGLLLGAFGMAPSSGFERITFNTTYLLDPLPIVIVALGIFAIPEILDLLRRQIMISESGALGSGWLQGLKDVVRDWFLVLRCSVMGAVLGALPGIGNTVIDWIAYGHVVQTSKDKSKFGKGDIRGVLAPESANNAKEGGALIPTLLLGIPGSGVMAIMLGGFIMIGIQPGLSMVKYHLDLVFIMIWSVAIANIVGAGACMLFSNQLAKITTIKNSIVAPIVLILVFFAAFQNTRDWGDLIGLFICGLFGVYMKRFGWPRPGLLIGFVLSRRIETSLQQTVQLYGFSFLKHPIVIMVCILIIISVISASRLKPKNPNLSDSGPHSHKGKFIQLVFYFIIFGFSLFVLREGITYTFIDKVYPVTIAILSIIILIPTGIQMLLYKKPHTVFYDTELEEFDQDVEIHSTEYYLCWIAGMLILSGIIGFQYGCVAFLYIFLRRIAKLPHWGCALSCGIMFTVFATLAHFLSLEYPMGILQWVLT